MSDLTPAQNERLRQAMLAFKRDECGDNITVLAKRLGRSQPSLSDFLNRKGGASFQTADRFANLVGKDMREILGPSEARAGEDIVVHLPNGGTLVAQAKTARPDPPVGTFLMKLRRLPGLERWLEENPTRLTVTQLAEGMSIYDDVKPVSRSDGQPMNGWDAFFEDALSGRLTQPMKGDVAGAEALERSQLSKATQRRLRTAPKKR